VESESLTEVIGSEKEMSVIVATGSFMNIHAVSFIIGPVCAGGQWYQFVSDSERVTSVLVTVCLLRNVFTGALISRTKCVCSP